MQKNIDEFLNQFFNQQHNMPNMPNVFDNKTFTNFISEQIQHAIPNYNHPGSGNGNEETQHDEPKGQEPQPEQMNAAEPHPQSAPNKRPPNRDIQYNVFETHDFVIARIAIQNGDPSSMKRLLINSHELFLKEEGKEQPTLKIKLPQPVNSKTTKILSRNRILEIQIKKKPSEPLSEFDITDAFFESEQHEGES